MNIIIKNMFTGKEIINGEYKNTNDAIKQNKVNLSGTDLREADLREADLSRADLRRANLSGADLSWADLSGADLRGAKYGGKTVLKILQISPIGSRKAQLIIYLFASGQKLYKTGCFSGDEDKFLENVEAAHKDKNPLHYSEYIGAITYAKTIHEVLLCK